MVLGRVEAAGARLRKGASGRDPRCRPRNEVSGSEDHALPNTHGADAQARYNPRNVGP